MHNKRLICYIGSFLLLLIFFVIGTFYDLEVAQFLYHPNDCISVFFTVLGLYLFYGSFVFLSGALIRQCLASNTTRKKKILYSCFCAYNGLSTSVLGSAALMANSCIGRFFERQFSLIECGVLSLVIMYPIIILGYIFNGNRYDKKTTKEIIKVLVLIAITYFATVYVKLIFFRPRYYATLYGYSEIIYQPWYEIKHTSMNTINQYSLDMDDFYSFPSGHAIFAVLNLIIVPKLSLVIPFLKNKQKLLFIISLVLIPCIMMSRLILGSHYLSDVTVGAIRGMILYAGYNNVNRLKFITDLFRKKARYK